MVMVDNSPSVMLLPHHAVAVSPRRSTTTTFRPWSGTYLRIVRVVVLLLTLFVTPVWYLLVKNPGYSP